MILVLLKLECSEMLARMIADSVYRHMPIIAPINVRATTL